MTQDAFDSLIKVKKKTYKELIKMFLIGYRIDIQI